MAEPKPAADDPVAQRLDEARKAHSRGWKHTPVRGKRPFLKDWQHKPDPELGEVERWAAAGNLGIRTGTVSGLVVIDDDTTDNSAAAKLGLPPTATVETGGGGRHHYFKDPARVRIKNSASRLATNVDVKGEGGMVVAVGSIHPETGKMYEWAQGLSPEEVGIAELPAHIIAAFNGKKARPDPFAPGTPEHDRLRRYAQGALRNHAESLARVALGQRNNALNRSAFVLGRFIGACLIDRSEVEDALRAAALAAGLEEREIHSTLHSGIEAGICDPHDLKVLARKATRAAEDEDDLPHPPRTDGKARPVIFIEGGKLPEIVDAAEQALLKDGGSQLYQRESLLVRMTRSSSVQLQDGIRRPKGALVLTLIEPAYLVERFTRAACFQKYDERKGDYKIVDCPERVAATYLARKGFWNVPLLRAVVEAPTLRPDGSILQTPGFDEATGLFFDAGGIEFEAVPENPTLDDARAALTRVLVVVKGFPFVEPCDQAVALAAMLTGLVRRSLRTAPLFGFRAPKMGSGKSLLADLIAMLATGRPAPVMPQGKDEDEDRKRMLALLIEGEPVNCVDNIERPFSSASLCSILTQVVWKDRVLGRTGTATVPTCATWLATGNNLLIVGDLSTRALVCDLDAQVEHPEEREFDVNLYASIPDQRSTLVPDLLTILRAYHLAGRPRQPLAVFGRFETWSDWVRSALVWCGQADPCATRKRIERIDPVRAQIQSVLAAWTDLIGTKEVTAAEVIAAANKNGNAKQTALWQALVDALGGVEADLYPLRLGHWLVKHERRPEGGLRLERVGDRRGSALWVVSHVR